MFTKSLLSKATCSNCWQAKEEMWYFQEKKKEATDSSSLNYSAGVLVATFHKAQTFRTDQVLDSKLSGISF